MNFLEDDLEASTILRLLSREAHLSFSDTRVEKPPQSPDKTTYLLPEAGLVVQIHPSNCRPWPAYLWELLGSTPMGEPSSLARISETLQRHGRLPVPSVLYYGKGAGPQGRDFTVEDVVAGRALDWEESEMSCVASCQLGNHLGAVHAATARSEGFGVFEGEILAGADWWPRFVRAYSTLADEICGFSSIVAEHRWQLEAFLLTAVSSPAPKSFPLICVDQNPSDYLTDKHGRLTGFINLEGHLYGPAEWEIANLLMWIPCEDEFREKYERHLAWPCAIDQVRNAYTTFILMEKLLRARNPINDPEEWRRLEMDLLWSLS